MRLKEIVYFNEGEIYKTTNYNDYSTGYIDSFNKEYYQRVNPEGGYVSVVSLNGDVAKYYHLVDPCATIYEGRESKYNHLLDEIDFPRKDLATFVSIDENDVLHDIYFSTDNYDDVLEISNKYGLKQPLNEELINDFYENQEDWVFNKEVPIEYKVRKKELIEKNDPLVRTFFSMTVKYDENKTPLFVKIYKFKNLKGDN